ncbi:MAG: molybdopterin-dependent oxidoreductase [Synergistaceae bacterium]|nr:molybdopterin-dependent oxidoreductase [Synergistaceae bacterium]
MNDKSFKKYVGISIPKIDDLSLACGTARYTSDYAIGVRGLLHLAFAYSDVPHAKITNIDVSEAFSVSGVVDIFTYENTPKTLYTTAGQGYPEPSPYDTRMFNQIVRYVREPIAAVLAESWDTAERAAKKIKAEFEPLTALFDPEEAMNDGAPKIHGGDDHVKLPVTYKPDRNIAGEVDFSYGNVIAAFNNAELTEEATYTTHCESHCAMEPHSAVALFDERGRLVIYATTQVPFHARRSIARITGIPAHKIRVIKPRLGGGFGSKQEIILEPYVAFAAWKHQRPVRCELRRKDVITMSRMRHQMHIHIRSAFDAEGKINALDMNDLMNSGAYGSHALTVLSNAASKVLPLFNKIENVNFTGYSVYTNLPTGGAYRGSGATQGFFALNQHIDTICRRLKLDMPEYVKEWHIKEGETSAVFEEVGEGTEGVDQVIKSCKLSQCIDIGVEKISWKEKRNKRERCGDWVRGVGMAVSMQGSAIPMVDMASAAIKMQDDGSCQLYVGATDTGTGSDTVLAQIAAETLQIPVEKVLVLSSDTDLTPFDTGAYASSTTYLSGSAVMKAALDLADQIRKAAALMLECPASEIHLQDGCAVSDAGSGVKISYAKIASDSFYSNNQRQLQAVASAVASESPAPFAAQFAEVAVDVRKGRVKVIKFVSVVDCGQAINPNLAEGQIHGAVLNGISWTLNEHHIFDNNGSITTNSLWDYKIPTIPDVPEMQVIIVPSYEPSGPYGAKSVSEVAINGPAPAIANAIFDAIGVRLYDLPFTPEKVWKAIKIKVN